MAQLDSTISGMPGMGMNHLYRKDANFGAVRAREGQNVLGERFKLIELDYGDPKDCCGINASCGQVSEEITAGRAAELAP